MQTLHFTLPASDCLPPALELLQLCRHSRRKAVQGKRKERSWVTDGQQKQGGLAQLPASGNRRTGIFFCWYSYCFRNRECTAIASQGAGFAKCQQEQGQSWCIFRKAKTGNSFSELSRLQPLSKPDGSTQSSFRHCHEAESHTHSSLHF